MAKRSVIAQVEEKQLRRASQYLKTRRPSETLKAALDFVAEKAAHEQVVRKYSGVGNRMPSKTVELAVLNMTAYSVSIRKTSPKEIRSYDRVSNL